MPTYPIRFIVSCFANLLFFSFIYFVISPSSLLNFFGFVAAGTSVLVLIWGGSAILAFVFTAIAFITFATIVYGLAIPLSVIIIAMLACILQALWTKHLISPYIAKQSWLSSRKALIKFLFLLGPATAIISAFTALVIAYIESNFQNGSYYFVFIANGVNSLLFSVFVVPLVLLRVGPQIINRRKRHFISIVALMGAVGLGLIFKVFIDSQQQQIINKFAEEANNVKQQVQQDLLVIEDKVNSVASFFKASEEVRLEEYNLFIKSILDKEESIRAIEWAPVISHSQRENFEKLASKILNRSFEVKKRTLKATLAHAPNKPFYAPLYYIYPEKGNESVYGLDVYSNPTAVNTLNMGNAKIIKQASASLSLLQDNKQTKAFLLTQYVYAKNHDHLSKDNLSHPHLVTPNILQGYIVAVIEFDVLFRYLKYLDDKDIVVLIKDNTNDAGDIIFGALDKISYRYSRHFKLNVFSRDWEVSLYEKKPWYIQYRSVQTWGVLIGVMIGGVIFQLLLLMTLTYSVELNNTVKEKTEALKKAKERLETENNEKLIYLNNLNTEFNQPLNELIAVAQQHSQVTESDNPLMTVSAIKNINKITDNMKQILDNVMAFSQLESVRTNIQETTIDFHGLVEHIEKRLNEHNTASVSCLLAPNIPTFVQADKTLLKKLLISLAESAQRIFAVEHLRLSINTHEHKKLNQVEQITMFFILMPHNDDAVHLAQQSGYFSKLSQENISLYSTQMAMVKEMCELLNGDVNFNLLSTGQGILSASIKIDISTDEQIEKHQGATFDRFPI